MHREGPTSVLTRDVAAFGLRQSTSAPAPRRVAPSDWQSFLGAVRHHRLTGLAVAAVEAGSLSLSQSQLPELLARHRDAMCLALSLEREVVELGRELRDANVPFVVLKGTAVARTLYPDPSWRPFGDVDLLVRTRDWAAACAVLTRRGLGRRFPEPRPGFTERFGKGALHVDARGLELDLHRMIADGPFGYRIPTGTLFERALPFDLGGVALRRLDDSGLLLNACLHAALGHNPPILLTLRDVLQSAWSPGVDWEKVHEWADRWRLRAVVRGALATAGERLAVPLPPGAKELCGSLRPDRSEVREYRLFTRVPRRRGAVEIQSLRAIPGLREKLAFAGAMLFPDRGFAVGREGGTSAGAYLRRWRVPIRLAFRR
jgi:hypothetical protein